VITQAESSKRFALITGGSSGIGLAIAHELARRKFSLLLVSNQETALQESKTAIEKQHEITCYTYCIDLALPDAPKRVYEYCTLQQIEVEILVNNAGILLFSELVAADPDKLDSILQLHVTLPTKMCNCFGRQMVSRGRGHILNVSSISSVMPYPGISVYGPTKTYLRYFSRALRSEMKIYGVNVTCLIPGATATALYDPNRVNLPLALKLGVMKSPAYVARKAVRRLFKRKAECIPGFLNKVIMVLMPLIPMRVIHWVHRHSDFLEKGKKHL
jgi:hypothetical protein